MARSGLEGSRIVRPRILGVVRAIDRTWQDLYLRYTPTSLSMSCANAIAARVATTDDEHVLALRCDAFLLRILMSRKYTVLLTE